MTLKRLPHNNLIVRSFGYLSPDEIKQRNYPINCRDAWGSTPLHEAAWWGKVEMVRFLLSKGADPFAKNTHEKTPLDFAENRGHDHIVEILRKIIAIV